MRYRTKSNIISTAWAVVYLGVFFFFVLNNWPMILAFAYIIFGYIVYKLLFKFLSWSYTRILIKHCDPEKHLAAVYRDFPEERRSYNTERRIRSNFSVSLLIFSGLSASGRFGDALAELNKITVFPGGSLEAYLKAIYLSCLISVYIKLNDISLAEETLAQLQRYIEENQFNTSRQKKLKNECDESGYLLNMAKGEFEGAEQFFIRQFNTSKAIMSRVYAKYHLGEIYSHYGDTVKAKDAFEYVAEHGNKLYIASQARETLTQL